MRALSALVVLALSSSSAMADFITNGSFETPSIAPGTFINYAAGSNAITGWTVFGGLGGNDVAVVNAFSDPPLLFQAQSGSQFVDLTGGGSGLTGIVQNVATVANATYDLSFFVGSATGPGFTTSVVRLEVNGVFAGDFINPVAPTTNIDWLQFNYQFTAPTALTSISFGNSALAFGNNLSALDNVRLELSAVPEPTSTTLVGIFALGILGTRRLRRFYGRAALSHVILDAIVIPNRS